MPVRRILLIGAGQGHLEVLPSGAREAAGESIETTLGYAQKLGPAGKELVAPAHEAFLDAMHLTALVSAGVALIGVVVVLLFLPGGRPKRAPAAEPEPEIELGSERESAGPDHDTRSVSEN